MANAVPQKSPRHWREIILGFLKIGSMAYGGPAIMGVMQQEFQEKRQWVTKEQFVEGLSLVNMLPGPGATQLGIFLGYCRGGWWGGLLAGLAFILPAFLIMLLLTFAYATLGTNPIIKGMLFGLGPVVLAIFVVAVYRLGRTTITGIFQILIATAASIAVAWRFIDISFVLLLAGGLGIFLFHSRKMGSVILSLLVAAIIYNFTLSAAPATAIPTQAIAASNTSLVDIGGFFFKVGGLTFGGGLTVVAFVEDQVVNQLHWLSHREFIDGLALGQFTPGPILIIAAYVGYKLMGISGALVGATAIFLPAFILMLSIMPIYQRVRNLRWIRAMIKGIGPAVIGVLVVSLVQMAPHAVPNYFTMALFALSVLLLIYWRVGSLKLMFGGAALGGLREYLLRR